MTTLLPFILYIALGMALLLAVIGVALILRGRTLHTSMTEHPPLFETLQEPLVDGSPVSSQYKETPHD